MGKTGTRWKGGSIRRKCGGDQSRGRWKVGAKRRKEGTTDLDSNRSPGTS